MSFLTLILSVLVILGSVTVESKCGYLGIPCCDYCTNNPTDILSATKQCRQVCEEGQGTCIKGKFPYGDTQCCPEKGDACCDVFGKSNCCNPAAPFCVGGICTDIKPCPGQFGYPLTCTSDKHCCPDTPYCSEDRCVKCKKFTPCKTNDDCCPEYFNCIGNQCVNYVIGRPYNLLNKKDGKDLRANVIIKDDTCDLNEDYINDMLSEHASIGTFNKFSIELMNLGAPLWFIQLSQNAALDEINHTKIMLNILNANDTKCVEIGKFPNHEIEFNGDCNAISLDVANGGCFGETISSINTMIKANKISELYSVAIDEVRHSTLAWVSAKWMINNCQNIDIANKKWWQNQLKQSDQLSIIKTIFNQFWDFQGNDYQTLYKIIHDMLYKEVSSIHQN